MPKLTPEPLSQAAFAQFGQVITTEGVAGQVINRGSALRFDALARIDVSPQAGQAGISLFRAQPCGSPVQLVCMERHVLGSQAFMPLAAQDQDRYLVVVAPPGEFSARQMRAFLATGLQGVNYAPGVWHHPLLALQRVSEFLVVDRLAPPTDCEEVVLDEAWWVEPTALIC